ncbi:glycosyltransferase [Zooshikella marina]|uniref:glycosyltransferase n=1 Tax=Zooshikella ganghwensis TaxID=202772 RepID=UPI001BAF3C86|nr:glycosyltransferase [Zooshikella ganghwensis]MBU2707347.1 glycosyltransferase [Zooshikella ganghwensis]
MTHKPTTIAIVANTPVLFNQAHNTMLRHLIDGMLHHGLQVQLICPHTQEEDHRYHPGLICVTPSHMMASSKKKLSLSPIAWLADYWAQNPPDAVYISSPSFMGWQVTRLASRLAIQTVTGFFDLTIPSHFNCVKHIANHLVLPWFNSKSKYSLVNSIHHARQFQSLRLKRLAILSHGVDSKRFAPCYRSTELRQQWQAGRHDLVFLYTGPLDQAHNAELALRTFRIIKDHFPSKQHKMLCIGSGKQAEHLKHRFPGITYINHVPASQLPKIYASADILLQPNKQGLLGNTVIEAMASGVVVVGFKRGAVAQHVQNHVSGLSISLNGGWVDEETFIDRVLALCDRPDKIASIKRNARYTALRQDWQYVTQQFIHLLLSPAPYTSKTQIQPSPL